LRWAGSGSGIVISTRSPSSRIGRPAGRDLMAQAVEFALQFSAIRIT
jgi:hypothetical protein